MASLSLRQMEILDIARRDGRVLVENLADQFSVSVQTIRRDLTALDQSGSLERVHGGAVLPSGVSAMGYADRCGLNEYSKAAIARCIAREIPNNSSIFLNIGTSTEAVARNLLNHNNLMVVTNNINVVHILQANPQCDIVITGGVLRRTDGGLVGQLTIATIEQFKFDYAVIGCSALDEDGDLLDFDFREVCVSQTIIRQSRHVFLAADQSKFRRTAPMRIDSLKNIDAFFTDAPLPETLLANCDKWNTAAYVCGTEM